MRSLFRYGGDVFLMLSVPEFGRLDGIEYHLVANLVRHEDDSE